MRGALNDSEQRVMLGEITVAEANAATRVIAANARDRDDLLMLLDAIRPTPHAPDAGPQRRRASPRWETS